MENKYQEIILKDGINVKGYTNDHISNFIKNANDYYEKYCLMRFERYIPKNGVIYDIGSNIGNHAIYFSKYYLPKKLYCFEPYEPSRMLLERNLYENNVMDVEVYAYAVGDENRKVSVESVEGNVGSTKVVERGNANIEGVRIDSLDFEKPDFVKIDVEGYEMKALRGMAETLKTSFPVIWIELHTYAFAQADNYLNKLGYVCVDKVEVNYLYVKPKSESDRNQLVQTMKRNAFLHGDELIRREREKYTKVYQSLRSEKLTCEKLNKSISDKNDEIDQLSSYNEGLIRRNDQLNNYNEELIRQNEQLNNYNEELIKQNDKIKGDVFAESQRYKMTLERINLLEKEMIIQTDKYKKASVEITELSLEAKDKSDQVHELEAQLSQRETQINELEENLIENINMEIKELEELSGSIESNKIISNELLALKASFDYIKRRYDVLSNSKLGKMQYFYWKFKKKFSKS